MVYDSTIGYGGRQQENVVRIISRISIVCGVARYTRLVQRDVGTTGYGMGRFLRPI